MPTEITFLRNLERDLTKVAEAERRRADAEARSVRRRRWQGWATAAAMLLGVALVIGVVQSLGDAQSNQFSTVGSAVNGAGGGGGGYSYAGSASGAGGVPAPVPGASGAPATPSETHGSKTDLTKIVRDGSISLSIDRGQFPDVARKVVAVARRNGGSVLSSTTAHADSGTFTLRIPASNFDAAMVQLAALGGVDSSVIQGKDVTADYLDAKAHLKIYLARRTFLFGVMAKATTTAESIAAQRELEQVQLQIDEITGQLRYLNNQVAISTIKVDVHEPGATPIDQPASDVADPSLADAFARGVHGFLTVVAAIVIGLGYLIPLLALAAIGFGVWRLVRRRGRNPGA